MPTREMMEENAREVFNKHHIYNVIGGIDGSHVIGVPYQADTRGDGKRVISEQERLVQLQCSCLWRL